MSRQRWRALPRLHSLQLLGLAGCEVSAVGMRELATAMHVACQR